MIIVGWFEEFEERKLNAFYKDGTLHISNTQDDEEDMLFGWHEDYEELPENFIEEDEEEIEYFFPVKNLTFDSKV